MNLDKVPIIVDDEEIALAELTIDKSAYPEKNTMKVTSVFVVKYKPENQALIEETVRKKYNLNGKEHKYSVFFCDEKA
jgi:hypothetical protein